MARTQSTFSYPEVEAALCIWECINEWTVLNTSMTRKEWVTLREGIGSAELRHQTIELGQWCLEIYNILIKHDSDFFSLISYDWDVIPMLLDYACSEDGAPIIYRQHLPDPDKVASLVAHRHLRYKYLYDCRYQAQRVWMYRELVDDHIDRFDAAFEDGVDPYDIVEIVGDKYGLIQAENW